VKNIMEKHHGKNICEKHHGKTSRKKTFVKNIMEDQEDWQEYP